MEILKQIIGAFSITSAIVVCVSAISALVQITRSAGSFSFLWRKLLGLLRILPPRKATWGIVYDANTKKPIPFVKVQLLDRNRRVLETRIADSDGRYGFLATPESLLAKNVEISILPSVRGYQFPSKTPVSIDTFVYNNLYYGDSIEINENMLVNFDIPMDPIRVSSAPLVLKSPSIAVGAGVALTADIGFWFGLLLVPLNFILVPNPFTFGTLCLFLGTASLRLFGISEHPYGIVKDVRTGHAMPFALITLNDNSGKRVTFTVSDERGRYFIVTKKGTYNLTVFTPNTIMPTRTSVVQVHARKGWITQELLV